MKHKFFSGAVLKDDTLSDRQIRVVVSTPTPDRVKDVMDPAGCDLANYRLNPIVLADHNTRTPIGTAAIETKSDRVEAVVTFAPAGISAKADEYCGLAKAGILNTVSPGFTETEVTPLKGGGAHIKKWELLELSLVAVPAQPEAVVIGRSLEKADGENWKVGASRTLPIGDDAEWDGAAAESGIFEKAGFDGDDPDTTFARKGFLVYDASKPAEKGSYKLPFAKVVDGRLTAMPSGIRAAASRLPQADIPATAAEKARAVLDHYEDQMKDKDKSAGSIRTKAVAAFSRKDLYDVSQLAQLLQSLVSMAVGADWEREIEGDESPLPEMLAEIARSAGEALIAMNEEETTECIARLSDLLPAEQKAFVAAGETPIVKALRAAGASIKAGRTFSATNAKTMAEACKSIMSGHDMIKSLLDEQDSGDKPDDEQAEADTAKAAPAMLTERQRDIDLLRLKGL